ncbi:MAG TPA: hypothetical protein PK322_04045 [Opitutaceae bacterium]|nr:hypothetical protein [Opitutaceae bacterium]
MTATTSPMPDDPTPAAQPAAPIQTNAADLARDLAASMPKATAPLPAAAHHVPAAPADVLPPAAGPAEVDALGRKFDAAKFAADAAGRPRKDKLGRFFSRLLGRGRGKTAPQPAAPPPGLVFPGGDAGQPPTPPNAAEGAGTGHSAPAAGSPDKYTLLADVYTRAAIAAAMGVFGDEWEPDNDAEFRGLRDSLAAYLRVKQTEDLSPGWALALAGITYGARRIPRPKTQGRIAFVRERVTAWWRGRAVSRAVGSQPAPGGAA